MQAGQFTISETQLGIEPIAVPKRLWLSSALWLPLLFFGTTFWIAQQDLLYASADFTDHEDEDLTPTPARQIGFIALGLYGALALATPTQVKLSPKKLQMFCLAALCVLIVLSAFWSESLELSMKRAMIPMLVVLATLGAVKHWRPQQMCLFILLLTSAYLLTGIAAELAHGTFMDSGRRFSGTLHPNSQGVNCAALALAALALYRDPNRSELPLSPRVCLALFGIGTSFLLLTKSRTATVAYLGALVVFLAMRLPRAKQYALFACLGFVLLTAIVGVFAVASEDKIDRVMFEAARMGRNQDAEALTSLTGRIPIWNQIVKDVLDQPILGYGYGGFWTDQRVDLYSYILDWEFSQAHNAYLETLLQIGAVGLEIGLLLVFSSLRTARRLYAATGDCGFGLAAAVLIMALVHGLVDGNFVLVGFEPVLVLMSIAVVALHGSQNSLSDSQGPHVATA